MRENLGNIEEVRKIISEADAVVIGAGSGLSTAAGYVYTGERFEKYFGDFAKSYGFKDMYSGGFYPYGSLEEYWAYWSRYIYINRYAKIPKDTYKMLYELVKDKNYFVITTNVDHCFQRAGFDKSRMFYTQGDYGLFQCSRPCHDKTYDNEDEVRKMVLAQGFEIDEDGELVVPEGELKTAIPSELVPLCPVCGEPMTMNLRADECFVEDEIWHEHSEMYADFLKENKEKKIVFLELGIGFNTPGIIRFPFESMTASFDDAKLVRVNMGYAMIPDELGDKAVSFDMDINEWVERIIN